MFSNKQQLDLLRGMIRIRRFQERVDSEYLKNEIRTPIHLYTGQEAIAIGVCATLERDDAISSNHRSHGHYLAKGGDMRALVAELYCRETGCSKGFGGSMHLIDVAVGHFGSSSIVGGGIPIGTGHAFAFSLRKDPWVSTVFLGDGAAEEGVFYESMNFAILKRLPVIFVVENNGTAVCSPINARQSCPLVFHQGYPPDALNSVRIDGNDVEEVMAAALTAVGKARRGDGPSLIECMTYRMAGHMGCAQQNPRGPDEEKITEAWKSKCPIRRYSERLLERGILSSDMLEAMEKTIVEEIDSSFAYAQASSFPPPSKAMGVVYRECD